MAVEVVLPMVGVTVEKGTIVKWLKREGERVKKGEALFIVEAEKVTTEVESPASGILARILVPEGVEVPLLTVVAIIAEEGEEVEAPSPARPQATSTTPSPAPIGGEEYDVVVIGGGPGGYTAAIRAAQLGGRVALVEAGELGGTCLNRGCVPTKCLLSDARVFDMARACEALGGKGRLGLGLRRMQARKAAVVQGLRQGLGGLVKAKGVELVLGRGRLRQASVVEVEGGRELRARRVIIATGSVPSLPGGLRADGQRILTSDHALELGRVPRRAVVVGGGVVGLELGLVWRVLGAEVVVVEMAGQLLPGEEPELVDVLRGALEERGIEIRLNTTVAGVDTAGGGVEVVLEGEEAGTLQADVVLLATGRSAAVEGLGLEEVGVELTEQGFVKVDETMATSREGVLAVGDVVGGYMLAHAAFAEAEVAAAVAMGREARVNPRLVPRCVYTFPELAGVGLGEAEARARGYEARAGSFPFKFNSRALAMAQPHGLVKVVGDERTGEILGVHVVGEGASELIAAAVVAMKAEAVMEDLADAPIAHPSLAEALKEAAMAWCGRGLHGG